MLKYKKTLAVLAAFIALAIFVFFVAPIVTQSQLSSDTRRFLESAFPKQTSISRYHVESYAIAFGDPGAYWEFRFGDEENKDFLPNYLNPGEYADDKAYIIKSVHEIWPDVSPETLETYSFFRGEILLENSLVCEAFKCTYYILQGPDRAFVNIFKN